MKAVRFPFLPILLGCLVVSLLFSSSSLASGGGKQAEAAYLKARASYDRLSRSARLRTDRRVWNKVIRDFRKVYLSYPDDPTIAPKTLYMMGRTYAELAGYTHSAQDLKEAIQRYMVLVERFPDSYLADDALYAVGHLYKQKGDAAKAQEAWENILERYPGGDFAKRAEARLKATGLYRSAAERRDDQGGGPPPERDKAGENFAAGASPTIKPGQAAARIQTIRQWTNPDYTRVVVDATGPVAFKEGSLPGNPAKGLPPRFYLDLSPAIKSPKMESSLDIQNGLLKGVRIAQFDPHTVRIVFDLGATQKIKAFYLEDPFRLVVDAFGEEYSKDTTCPRPEKAEAKPEEKAAVSSPGHPLSLAQQLGLCVRRVVVDAGHGGKDPGAIGPHGLKEKDVTLRIARKVAERLRKELGVEAILTRDKDVFLPLEQRTAIANAKKADLFISIHVNAAPSRNLRGVETYFLNFALDGDAMRVAARENATSTKRIGDLQKILNDILRNAKVSESSRLADHIQSQVIGGLDHRFGRIPDLGVKQAPFFVLIGARMPAALVEVSFISNRLDERRLQDSAYLDTLAAGIVQGVVSYSRDTQLAYLPSKR